MAISKKAETQSRIYNCRCDVKSAAIRLSYMAQDPDLWFARSDVMYAIEMLDKANDILSRAMTAVENNYEEE